MARTTTNIFVLFVLSVTGIEGARILGFFPTPSISHQVVFRPIIHELARRGHEVIVVTPDPVFPKGKSPGNLTEIDVRDVSYSKWQELFVHHNGNKQDLMLQVRLIFERFATILDAQLETTEVRNMFKNKDRKYFDLLILEACNRPLMGLAHVFDAPVIVISSFGAVPIQYNSLGAPIHPLLYPTPGRQRLYNLSLWEKGLEVLKYLGLEFLIAQTEDFDNQIMRKHFGKDVPTYEVLRKKIQMMFLNEHPIWADNRPVPPSIVYIGGIHQSIEKELPKDLKKYLDSSKHGAIYVSFGTNVLPSILPPEQIKIMTKVLSELPYDVLWKWDVDVLPGQSKNIKIAKWFPQTDVLSHPNVKLFITQGGLQSTDEAIDATVPLIGIPMLGDQWYNVEKYVHLKIGLQHDLNSLTEDDFKNSITTIIKDKSFKDNIIRLKELMRSYAIKPVDNAVWWVEHVLKHGGSHLRAPTADMSFADYYEIELVLIMLAIIVSILIVSGFILKLVINFVLKLFKTNTKVKAH